jgi:hypothetical protein
MNTEISSVFIFCWLKVFNTVQSIPLLLSTLIGLLRWLSLKVGTPGVRPLAQYSSKCCLHSAVTKREQELQQSQ